MNILLTSPGLTSPKIINYLKQADQAAKVHCNLQGIEDKKALRNLVITAAANRILQYCDDSQPLQVREQEGKLYDTLSIEQREGLNQVINRLAIDFDHTGIDSGKLRNLIIHARIQYIRDQRLYQLSDIEYLKNEYVLSEVLSHLSLQELEQKKTVSQQWQKLLLQAKKNLKVIDLSMQKKYIDDEYIIKLVAKCPNIEHLDISGCDSISAKGLIALQNLKNLRSLTMQNLKSIVSLSEIKNLVKLEYLDLGNCENLKSLEGLNSLLQLKSLKLNSIYEINSIRPLQHLINLQHLDLSDCEVIRDIETVSRLNQLRSLNISGSDFIGDISFLRDLPNLVSLNLSNIKKIHLLPLTDLLLNELRSLNISGCDFVGGISFVKDLPNLVSLNLSNIEETDLQPLADLPLLMDLTLGNWWINNEHLEFIKNQKQLQHLNLNQCHQITNIDCLADLNLISLNLNNLMALKNFDVLKKMKLLVDLDLGNSGFRQFDILQELIALEKLNLDNTEIRNTSSLKKLKNLAELSCARNPYLTDISELKDLKKLTLLDLFGTSIENFLPISELSLTSLSYMPSPIDHIRNQKFTNQEYRQNFFAKAMDNLKGVLPELVDLNQLKLIDVSFEDINFLSKYKKLKELELVNLLKLTDINSLNSENLRSIEKLFLCRCNSIPAEQLDNLRNLRHITDLIIQTDNEN